MKKPVFVGSNAAIVTPFNNINKINYVEVKKIIEFLISNNVNAITVCGTTGEVSTLTLIEHQKMISYCAEIVNKRVPIIAGVGSNNTANVLSLTKFANTCGVDALLTVTPYYNKTNDNGLIKHFFSIADCSEVPIILYNIPGRTGVNIKPKLYYELSKHMNINGVKEASGNFSEIILAMNLCKENLNFWSGNDDQILPMLALGAKGVISVLANIFPNDVSKMIYNFYNGKFIEALNLQFKFIELIKNLFIEVNPIPIKSLMNYIGFNVGNLRMPLFEMEENNLKKLINAYKNVIKE